MSPKAKKSGSAAKSGGSTRKKSAARPKAKSTSKAKAASKKKPKAKAKAKVDKKRGAASKKTGAKSASAGRKKTPKAPKAKERKKKSRKTKTRKARRPRLTPKQLAYYRSLLEQKQQELTAAYQISKGDSRSDLDDGTEDYIDYAVHSYAREFLLSLSEMDRKQLFRVEEALERLGRGEFGYCLQCHSPINPKRLEVAPWARYCVPCQELDELGLLQEPGSADEDEDGESATDEDEPEGDDSDEDEADGAGGDDDEEDSDDEDDT